MITLKYDMRLISKDNDCVINRYTGRKMLSRKFLNFENEIKRLTKTQYKGEIITGSIGMSITALFTNKKHCDCQNLSKGICDALQSIVYKDDRQIKEIFIKVFEGEKEDCFQVDIEPISQGTKPLPGQ